MSTEKPSDPISQLDYLAQTVEVLARQNDIIEARCKHLEKWCSYIVELASGWDEDGALGPKEPLSWESVGRMAMDYARVALKGQASGAEIGSENPAKPGAKEALK